MDGGKHEKALTLFEKALAIDPDAVDALLHRANLRMLQSNLTEAR
jgi:Tfp pilus assembly protein PilF